MHRFALYLLALAFACAATAARADCAWIYEGAGKPASAGEAHPPAIELCRTGYLVSYDPEAKLARWVMQHLTPEALSGHADRRKSSFRPDPALPEGARAELADYKGSGFDRGHLAPAADFKHDQRAMDESFYLTNVAPQVGNGFNRHLWRDLEAAVREMVRQGGELYVVTGPLTADGTGELGSNRIPLPWAFYKAVYDPQSGKTQAWLVPNEAHEGIPYSAFEIPLAELEVLTGLGFWPQLHPRQIPSRPALP